MRGISLALTLSVFVLGGCASSIDIQHAEQKGDGFYLTVDDTANLSVGGSFKVVASKASTENFSHGHLRKVLGTVKLVQIIDSHSVMVRLISGTIADGASLEEMH